MSRSTRTPLSLRAFFGAAVAATTFAGAARADKPSTCEAFQQDPRVGKHLTVKCDRPNMPYWDCSPAGTWAQVATKCGSDLTDFGDHADCAIPADAIEGKLSADHATLFTDLAASAKGNWTKCRMGPENGWVTGVVGLGLMRAKASAPTLVELIEPSTVNDTDLGGDGKRSVVEALWRMGAKETDAAIAALLPTGTGVFEFRYASLAALSAWGSDAAVEYCTKAIGDRHDETARACATYLADRGKTEAVPMMLRNIDRLRAEGIRALGRLAGKDGKVKALLEEKAKAGGNDFVPARLALFEAGDAKAFKEIQERLEDFGWFRNNALALSWATDKKAAAAIIGWLTKRDAALAKEDKSHSARAMLIRAQLGDPKAITAVADLLESPDADIRRFILRGVGGDFGTLGDSSGRRIVASAALIPAVKAFYAAESNPEDKAMALAAWANLVAITSL